MNRLGVEGNDICCLAIVAIFMGLQGASGGGSKFKRRSDKIKEGNFYVVVDPSAILSELPISISFGVIRVLWYALHNIPSY